MFWSRRVRCGPLSRAVLASMVLGLFAVPTAEAELIHFTGDVGRDFPQTRSFVRSISDRVGDVAQPAWMTRHGWVNGWDIKGIRLAYDRATDTLNVGVDFVTLAGRAIGNADPKYANPLLQAAGGIDLPHLGGRKSIAVAFAADSRGGAGPGTPVLIAGVPEYKSAHPSTLDGFTVAHYLNTRNGLAMNFGSTWKDHLGKLAFDPSAAHPDFEFTITQFSKIPGIGPGRAVWVGAFAGSPDDALAGEDNVAFVRIPAIIPNPQVIPEPAGFTLMGLGLIGLAAGGCRRRRKVKASAA